MKEGIAAHLGWLGDDLEHTGEEGVDAADVGEEDDPRRGRRRTARFATPSSDLREEEGGDEVQEGAHERSLDEGARRRRILRCSPAAMAEQGKGDTSLAAAARRIEGENGT